MLIPLYHVDAFTNKVFAGNPAAVCLLPQWQSDERLHAIAKENNLPVTAFLVHSGSYYEIRWITPEYELTLCGHGSLAAAYVIFTILEPTCQQVELKSNIETIKILRQDDRITLNFPTKDLTQCDSYPVLENGLGLKPKEIYLHKKERCLVVYETEEQIKSLIPDMQILKQADHAGITVTAPGDAVDFVSRTFYPQKSCSEDAVTGASHCLLAPYWAKRLNKTELHALQVSQRGGEIFCAYRGDRVLISGSAVLYMRGEITLE